MGSTVLVELKEFMKGGVLPAIPVKQPRATLPDQTVSDARGTLSTLFYGNSNPKNLINVKEDEIAVTVVNVINTALSALELPPEGFRYKAALSRYNANLSDETGSKVDAALYEEHVTPSDDNQCPDWTNCCFYIEFKTSDAGNDPWNDRSGKAANEAKTRARVRAQLIAYARNVFLYQHRTALFSLFIIGNSFRAARWDRSGVIVSKKVDYADDPRSLLDLICHLVQLDSTLQGLDPTADLIKPDSKAFRIMNELAEPNSAQDMEYMEAGTENYIPPPAHPPPVKLSPEASATPSGSATVNTPQEGITHSARAPKQRTRGKQPASATPQAAQDLPTGISDAKEAPDADLPEIEVVPGEDLRVFRYVREKFRESLVPGWPRYKLRIKVRVGDEDEVRVFLVAKPLFEASSMFGRATRGYVAIDARTRRFVFLKDSWRPFYKGVLQEGAHLERFAGDDQIIVPAIVCHGDVENQYTYTAQYQELSKKKAKEAARLRILKEREEAASSTVAAEKKVNKRKRGRSVEAEGGDLFSDPSPIGDADLSEVTLRHHIHYRMVVKDVCLPFEMFRSTEQLIRLMSDCVATHHYVYEKHQLLHRDISAGNVLILPRLVKDHQGKEIVQWRGVLTDWELAKTYLEKRSDEKARQPERTGTWQFMSVAYVNSQWTQPISVADSLESFFHVILFFAIRFLPHTFSSPTKFVEQYFDTFWDLGNDVRECSLWKITAMRHGVFESGTEELEFLKTDRRQGNPFNAFIREILEPFKARYEILKYESRLAKQLLRSAANPPDSAVEAPVDDPTLPRFLSDVKDWRRPPIPAAPVRKATSLVPPTQEIRDLAALLDDHQWVLGLFADIRRQPLTEPSEWGGTLVVQDQLVGYEPRMMLMRKATTTQQTGTLGTDEGATKRHRNAGSNFASSSSQLYETGQT